MAATHQRAVVSVDGNEIHCLEAHYVVDRQSSGNGRRIGDSMRARAFFYADIADTARNPADTVIGLWKMSTETEDPLHKVEIAFYSEGENKRLQTVKFQGWISKFETFSPSRNGNGAPAMNANHLLYCEITVALDDKNISKHQLTK